MSSQNKPAYYAVIPAHVRYDDKLPANAKLLFGEITALCGASGECWATNKYFADLYGVKPTTVSEWVSLLDMQGHITVEITNGYKRFIRIPLPEKTKGASEKAETPPSEKAEDNNTSVSNTYNSEAAKQRRQIYRLYVLVFKAGVRDMSKPIDNAAYTRELNRYKLTPRREAAIDRRLKDAGFNMLRAAIMGFGNDEFYTGGGNRGWVADLEQYICRNYENVEKGANLYEKQRAGTANSGDDWDKLG